MKSIDKKKSEYCKQFEIEVNKLHPDTIGRIEWVSAHYSYNMGIPPLEAAYRYVNARVSGGELRSL